MTDPLAGSKLKIERANGQIKEVNKLIQAFLSTKPYETFIQIDSVEGKKSLKARGTEKPPAQIAVVCGEILYSLRSALDHLVTATAARSGVVVIKRQGSL